MVPSLKSLISKAAAGLATAALIVATPPVDEARAQGYGPGLPPISVAGPGLPASAPSVARGPIGPPLVLIGRNYVNPYALTYGFHKEGGGWTVVCRGRAVLDLTEEEGQRLVAMQPPRVGRFYLNPNLMAHFYRMQDGGWIVGFDDGSSLQLTEEEGQELVRLIEAAPVAAAPYTGPSAAISPRAPATPAYPIAEGQLPAPPAVGPGDPGGRYPLVPAPPGPVRAPGAPASQGAVPAAPAISGPYGAPQPPAGPPVDSSQPTIGNSRRRLMPLTTGVAQPPA